MKKEEEIERETLEFLFGHVQSSEDVKLIGDAIQDYKEDCGKYNFMSYEKRVKELEEDFWKV